MKILNGNCIDRMREMDSNSIEAIVSDPPYGLKFMGKNWDDMGEGSSQRKWHEEWLREAFRVLKSGGVIKAFSGTRTFHHLMGAMENVGFTELRLEAWNYGSGFPKSLNISKAIDKAAGMERDVVGVVKGMGKQNPEWNGKAQGRAENSFKPEYERTVATSEDAKLWDGWGTALKPAWEPICIGRKP
jgi:site-specific DNA-methyltransferase (adenine-specific)